jgi:hypothetical protein
MSKFFGVLQYSNKGNCSAIFGTSGNGSRDLIIMESDCTRPTFTLTREILKRNENVTLRENDLQKP